MIARHLIVFTTVLFLGYANANQLNDKAVTVSTTEDESKSHKASASQSHIYEYCSFCHGGTGQGASNAGVPKIAGQEPWYLERQLRNFWLGYRGTHKEDLPGRLMAVFASVVTDTQSLNELVSYISSLPVSDHDIEQADLSQMIPPEVNPEFDVIKAKATADVGRGSNIYKTSCATCHGDKAEGNELLAGPRLDNKADYYLYRQMKYFQQGIRGWHENDIYGRQMAAIASQLNNEQDIADVLAYISTFSRGPFPPSGSKYQGKDLLEERMEDQAPLNDAVEIMLSNKFPDQPYGYCLDSPGREDIVILVGPAHALTCLSFRGWIATDQAFGKAALLNDGELRFISYDSCLAPKEVKAGVPLWMTDCSGDEKQQFIIRSNGEISPQMEPQLCLTLSEKNARFIGRVLLDYCSEEKQAFQRWELSALPE